MSHTKGELKAGEIRCGQFSVFIAKRHFARIAFTHLDDMKRDEANVAELVRRWNAFEENGLVSDLLDACKAAQIMLLQTNWNGDERLDIVHNAITKAKQ